MERRSLYMKKYNIRFISGMNMGEDLMVMMRLFIHSNCVSFCKKALSIIMVSLIMSSLTKTYLEKKAQAGGSCKNFTKVRREY